MKKKDAVSIMLIVLLMLISCGCQPSIGSKGDAYNDVLSESGDISSEAAAEDNITPLFAAVGCNTDDDYAAITHLGYDLNDDLVLQTITERIKGINSSEIADSIEQVRLEGNEFYLIIPKYKNSVITVYRTNEDEIYDEASPVGVYDKPIVIICNESDIISNAVVKIQYSNPDGSMGAVTVTPFLSLMDGSLCDTEHIFEF